MIPEYLQNKKILSEFLGINIPSKSWVKVKRNYYSVDIPIDTIKSTDLIYVDLYKAPIRRCIVSDGKITLFANKRPADLIIDIHVLDDSTMNVGVSTKDKYYMADPKKG